MISDYCYYLMFAALGRTSWVAFFAII